LKNENIQWQAKFETMSEEMEKLDQEVKYWRNKSRDQSLEIKRISNLLTKNKVRNSKLTRKKVSDVVEREVGQIKEENRLIKQMNRKYQSEIKKLKEIKNFWVQGHEFPLKPLKYFSDSAIRETNTNYGLHEGDIVLVLDPSGGGAQTAFKLINSGIRGVITPVNSPKFSDQALQVFNENCVPCLELPLEEYTTRDHTLPTPSLEIWVYDELYMTDISVKEEIRKQELQLEEKLRRKRMSLLIEQKVASRITQVDEFSIENLLNDFKEEYIALYQSPDFDLFQELYSEEE
jgi:predicted RNase H-like nuclease (RuvC/YqgF family)